MSPTEIIIIAVAAVAVIAVVVAAWLWWRHHSLRTRFGPEYDRAASEHGGRLAADRDLRDRERRHAKLELRPLEPAARQRYAISWQQIQAQFVETPEAAIDAADGLVEQLIVDRGYPVEDETEKLEQLSVDHARTLGHYRDAHEIYLRHQRGEASTEQLRQALVHYRMLFADLLGEEPVDGHRSDEHDRSRDSIRR